MMWQQCAHIYLLNTDHRKDSALAAQAGCPGDRPIMPQADDDDEQVGQFGVNVCMLE
jgi:hypothetical protein